MAENVANEYVNAIREAGRFTGAGCAAVGILGGGVGIGLVFQGFLIQVFEFVGVFFNSTYSMLG